MYGKPLPIVDAFGAPAASANAPTHTKSASFEYLTTRKDELVGWARKFSLFPYPFVTACCAMEFMAVSASTYDTDRFGAALPRVGSIRTTRRCPASTASFRWTCTCRDVRRALRW